MFKDIISGIVSGVIGGLVVLIIQLYLDYRKNSRESRLKMLAGNKTQKILDEKLKQGIPVGLQVGVYNLTYFLWIKYLCQVSNQWGETL